MKKYSQEYYQLAADYILDRIDQKPKLALVLGSALGDFTKHINISLEIDYEDIPNFLVSTVASHAGKLIFGTINGKEIVCMSGRFHYYEGYSFEDLVAPIRVLALIGVENIILTNAAGGVNEDYQAGDLMLITDHIKLMGASPLRGENFESFGPRFFDMSNAYDKEFQEIARQTAKDLNIDLKEGIYFFMPGPQFETPAEIRAIRSLGGDAVGMSTVTEVITAAHMGLKVLAISMITNMAAGMEADKLSTEEVDITAEKNAEKFQTLMIHLINNIEA